MTVTTPPERTIQVPVNNRVVVVQENNRTVIVPDDE